MRSEGLWESLSKGFRSRYWAKVGARAKMGRRGRGSGEEKINSLFNQHYHTAPITSCVRGRKHFQNRGVSGKRSFSPLLQSSFISIFRSCSNFLDEPTLKRLLCRLKQKKKKKKTDTNINNIPLKIGNTAPLKPCWEKTFRCATWEKGDQLI